MSSTTDAGAGAILGMVGGGMNARKQYHRQKKLMGLQQQNQMMLNRQGHDLQMDMWNKTNYGAQVKHMEDAGLNPALMYGMSGGGGTTAGSQGGGSAASGQAQTQTAMDMANIGLIKAQIDNIKADTELKGSQKGVNEEQTRKIQAEFRNIEQDTIKKIQETTNLKTVDDWNKVRKGLDELKESKKVTGSSVVDLMTQLGLDPVNNTEDANAVRILLGTFYGSTVAKNIMNGIGSMRRGTKIGEIFNNTNIHNK